MIYWVLSFNPNIKYLPFITFVCFLFYFNERNEEKQLLLIRLIFKTFVTEACQFLRSKKLIIQDISHHGSTA